MKFGIQNLFGGDPGISQTVAAIRRAIDFALKEPSQAIRRRAESIIRNVTERSEPAEVRTIFAFVESHLHYAHDPVGLEYVKSPEISDAEISSRGSFVGDCDDAAGYLAALLKSVGYSVRLTVANTSDNPNDDFNHIYVKVYMRTAPSPLSASWVTLDATAKGRPLGWEAPHRRTKDFNV